jgi:hypothetical protein
MIKKLLISLLVVTVGLSAYIYWIYSERRTLITPYPYSFLNSFDTKYDNDHAEELKAAQDAKILIVGDRMGKTLSPYIDGLKDQFKKALKTPPSFYNWSEDNEGLFRTLYKLKKLKKFPPVIIYFGASSELTEKKFNVEDKKLIDKNFATYDNEKLISLIITFPWLSKILYKPITYFDVGPFKEYKSVEASSNKLLEKELSFKLFSYELKEMSDLIRDHKSNLVLITTPINLEIAPREICAHASNHMIVGLQQEIDADIKQGSFKKVYPKARELAQATPVNAMSFYLLGKAALGTGDIKTAREALIRSAAFDCASWRGSPVYNAILKAQAKKSQINLIDFDQYMNSQLSRDALFFDELVPQNVFYQNMIKELGDILKNIMSVSDQGDPV